MPAIENEDLIAIERAQWAPVSQEAGIPPRFDIMAKPTGAVCNLGCSYWRCEGDGGTGPAAA